MTVYAYPRRFTYSPRVAGAWTCCPEATYRWLAAWCVRWQPPRVQRSASGYHPRVSGYHHGVPTPVPQDCPLSAAAAGGRPLLVDAVCWHHLLTATVFRRQFSGIDFCWEEYP